MIYCRVEFNVLNAAAIDERCMYTPTLFLPSFYEGGGGGFMTSILAPLMEKAFTTWVLNNSVLEE